MEKNGKVKEITIGRSFKISKNYNSADASMSMNIEVDDDTNLDEVVAYWNSFIKEKCLDQLKKFKGEV